MCDSCPTCVRRSVGRTAAAAGGTTTAMAAMVVAALTLDDWVALCVCVMSMIRVYLDTDEERLERRETRVTWTASGGAAAHGSDAGTRVCVSDCCCCVSVCVFAAPLRPLPAHHIERHRGGRAPNRP